jgi:hypothetical protein
MASCEARGGERGGGSRGRREEPVLRRERREQSGSEITLACCCCGYLYDLIDTPRLCPFACMKIRDADQREKLYCFS